MSKISLRCCFAVLNEGQGLRAL